MPKCKMKRELKESTKKREGEINSESKGAREMMGRENKREKYNGMVSVNIALTLGAHMSSEC